MYKICFVVVAFALGFSSAGFSSAALAQALSAEQRAACQADYNKYCKGTMPGGGRIIACLNKQRDQISDACKKVLDAQQK
jgi:Cysteine rich repeat